MSMQTLDDVLEMLDEMRRDDSLDRRLSRMRDRIQEVQRLLGLPPLDFDDVDPRPPDPHA